jgi:peptide/nickel transport system substrate-binding protein
MLRRIAAILAASLVLMACAPTQPPSTPPAQTGGAQQPAQPAEKRSADQSLRLAQIGLPASLSPAASAANLTVYAAMYDSLVWLDLKANVTPELATRWVMASPTSWRLTIRTDATFSNGDKVTADDVEFSVNTIYNEKFPQISQVNNLIGAKKVDETTVDILTRIPDASVMPGLLYLWIMPKKYYESVGKDAFAVKPIGSGPYELVDFRNNDIAIFKKRSVEHPWRKVVATDLTFRSITEQQQMVNGMRTGDLDFAYGSLSPDIVEAFSKTDAVVKYRTTGNVSGLISQPEMKMRDTPLQDKRVRLAMNYAVDKEAIAKNLYKGYAIPTGQMSVPTSPGWNPDVKPVPYDPAMAKKLLAEAGYPNGFKLAVGIEYTPQTVNPNLALAIQSNLKDVGIDAPLTPYELALFLDKYYGRNGQVKGDIFLQATGDGNGFMTQAQGLYSCKLPLVWWCSQVFDDNMALANGELDVTKRGVLMRNAIAGFTDDVAHINLIISSGFVIYSPKIRGYDYDSSASVRFDAAYRID